MKMAYVVAFAGLTLAGAGTELQAGWGIGVRIGGPVYYGPWAPYYYPYYPYGAIYAAAPPVVVESAPVVVQPAPSPQAPSTPLTLPPAPVPISGVQPASQTAPSPLPSTLVGSQVQEVLQTDVNYHLQQLRNPDERVRADSVLQLGRLKAAASVDPLAATLAGDRSPLVREAAARALALIGSPKALPALRYAAQADPDRDVRRSAQFAVEVVLSRH
jgi:hypothetical protein